MNDKTQQIVNVFSNFLSQNEVRIKDKGSSGTLISFAYRLDGYIFFEKIDKMLKHYERSFYLEKPSAGTAFIGLDEVINISENGEGRFAITEKKTKEWKENFISNWEVIPYKKIPLFVGGMKFSTGRDDDEWQDYEDSSWFIPEILLLNKNNEQFLLFNFIYSPGVSKENLINRLKSKLEKLSNLNSSPDKKTTLKILSVEGTSPKDKKKWKNLVSEAVEKINENQIEKIVLSRKIELKVSEAPNFNLIIDKLKNSYPDCLLFIFHRGKSSFFGATPEKLAEFSNGNIEIDALAGSAQRGSTKEEDLLFEKELLNDKKNLNEHNIVLDYIKNSLSRFTKEIKIEKHCSIKKLANIQHIWSKITAELTSNSSVFNILKELFPTPAVCGLPKDTALHLIKKMEGYRRGLYAGIIGWFNFEDEGEFAVAIRSALYNGNKLIAYAGNGIVTDSDPESEYKETELKLKTIMSLFVNENKN